MRTVWNLIAGMVAFAGLTGSAWAANPLLHAVAADHELAERAGFSILEQGGNAVDAAVATSFALAVVRPESCGIGGGGFMVIHLVDNPLTAEPKDVFDIAIDYRERAPGAITPTAFAELPSDASTVSGLAVAVPGTVAGLLEALEKYGSMPREVVLAPAIALARDGYAQDAFGARATSVLREELASTRPDEAARAFLSRFLPADPAASAQHRVQLPELAGALERIAKDGRAGFYTGPVAEAIVAAVQSRGGVMTVEDLGAYRPVELPPLRAEVLGRTVLTMPPPSSGGIAILQCLMMIEERRDLLANVQRTGSSFYNLVGEALKLAFADRARFLADPETVDIPVQGLLDRTRARERSLRIKNLKVLAADDPAVLAPLPEDHGTSHLCVVDKAGNAVSCTETVNLGFGSRIPVVPFGFFLNNEMDDFLTKPGHPNAFGLTQAEANLPGPHKRPLSSMSPTIILDDAGRVQMVVGASGGPRIISATLQVILGVVMYRQDPQRAVNDPRIHHQWNPDVLSYERDVPISTDSIRALRERGHVVEAEDDGAAVQCIVRDPARPLLWQTGVDGRKRSTKAGN